MEAKLHHSDSLDILCRKVNLMALDTAMKIEEILKISLYVTQLSHLKNLFNPLIYQCF